MEIKVSKKNVLLFIALQLFLVVSVLYMSYQYNKIQDTQYLTPEAFAQKYQ